MEHRWGWRLRVDLTARVGDATGLMNIARLRDVSVSGAFLETAAILRAFSSVDVQFRTHTGSNSRLLSAQVVRTTPDGVGIEWREFAPHEVARLMETHPAPARSKPPIELPAAREPANHGAVAGRL
jgi:PilZ domain-containing protein